MRGVIRQDAQPLVEQLIAALSDQVRRLAAQHLLLRSVLAERDERGEDFDERLGFALAVAGGPGSGEAPAGVVERAARVTEPQQCLRDGAQALRLDSLVSRAASAGPGRFAFHDL